MAASSPSRQAATKRRRCSILQAARAVFARQGYANTVVEDIATETGIAKGTLYIYFPSKEHIYLAALLEEARQLDADSRAAMSAAATWRDKLGAYLQVRLHYFEAHQDFLRIYMTEFRGMCMQGKHASAEFINMMQERETKLAKLLA
jgi:AcrR family transcriptional regulator